MVSLADKYELDEGRVLISGTQALVRLTLLQHDSDRQAGLNTGGYVTGYRGSPLGGVDLAFWQIQRQLEEAGGKVEELGSELKKAPADKLKNLLGQ